MEKERGAKVIAIVALLIAVVGLTIGYAAYSDTLKIDGSANVDPAEWDVHFALKSGDKLTASIVGDAIENTNPTLASTTISGFDVTLKAPGDSATYDFYVKNTGTLDATLTAFTMGSISCSPNTNSSATSEEATKLCGELKYTLTYADGNSITTGSTLVKNTGSSELILKLEWPSTSTLKVSDDIKVTIGTTSLVYEQAKK